MFSKILKYFSSCWIHAAVCHFRLLCLLKSWSTTWRPIWDAAVGDRVLVPLPSRARIVPLYDLLVLSVRRFRSGLTKGFLRIGESACSRNRDVSITRQIP